jgi:valyl-tRNA synthetase
MNQPSKAYDPRQVEDAWYRRWLEKDLFHGEAAAGGTPYCIVIPPPNVTGILHMGHALNNTIQDALIRWRRMKGDNAVWVPGVDHAGIATQNVVERTLKKEGKTRDALGREAFVERVWAWKEQYGQTIVSQLKRLGASCDWARERFTMDEGLSRAVTEVFIRLYEKKLIYRGHYIINWCPRCRTALSDEESEHREVKGRLYYIRYPVHGEPGRQVVVATTRPETLLGDTAVAVNPKDERYRGLIGKTLRLPVLNREIPVIADDFVDPQFGTGCVKVTPAHDPNDFAMGKRHQLPEVNVMTDDGRMNEAAGPYAGQERFVCRNHIVADLEKAGLLEKVEDHPHAVGHCYRCHTVVEPRLSRQWFVKMKPLAEPAIAAVRDGRITFVPERWTGVYLDWMENIRDWCISRQIWWGHRVPVFYCDACDHAWAARGRPAACPACHSPRIRQDEDVLDTWFSSWLWPFSVFGWPEPGPDLKFYYPTHTLVTASEIIFFWVARMIMAGLEFMNDIPFRQVYIHGTVRDDVGLKMSKSLGNSIDPLAIIDKYSADALRFSLMMLTATGQDVYVSDEKFEIGRNFLTKIWNATRFMKAHAGDGSERLARSARRPGRPGPDAQHLLYQLNETVRACDEHLARFRFNDYARALYEFVWRQFCDWYLEHAKPRLRETGPRREEALEAMYYSMSVALRLLHPLMPFQTEELWHDLGFAGPGESILRAPWPAAASPEELAENGIHADAVSFVEAKHELIRTARNLRADASIPPAARVRFVLKASRAEDVERLAADQDSIAALLKNSDLAVDSAFMPGRAMPSALTSFGTLFMSLEGAVDAEAEKARLTGQIQKLDLDIERIAQKLENQDFVGKAPADVVNLQRTRQRELAEKRARLESMIAALEGGK